MTLIVGMTAFGMGAATLARDGVVEAMAAEEWFSRRKDDPSMPVRAFEDCLRRADVRRDQLDGVVFAEKPTQRFQRILGHLATGFPRTSRGFRQHLSSWLGGRLWLKSALVRELGLQPDQVLMVEQDVALATSAMLSSPFDEATVLIVDDCLEWASVTLCHGRRTDGGVQLKRLAEIPVPHSLPGFIEAVAHELQLPEGQALRWLAPQGLRGRPSHHDVVAEMVPERADGAFALERRFFVQDSGRLRLSHRGREALGLNGSSVEPGDPAARESARNLACSLQEVVATRVRALLQEARRRHPCARLCLGGRLFRDPVVLARALADVGHEQVHVDPQLDGFAAAIGAMGFVSGQVTVKRSGVAATDSDGAASAAARLAEGQVVAWGEGGAEIHGTPTGQRALLVDPTQPAAVTKLRRQVKLAEDSVPVALALREGDFDKISPDSPSTPTVTGQACVRLRDDTTTRLDDGCRVAGRGLVREIRRDRLPGLAAVLDEFERRSGGSLLGLSSLNRAGEPTVVTREEAQDLVQRSAVDALFWNGSEGAE